MKRLTEEQRQEVVKIHQGWSGGEEELIEAIRLALDEPMFSRQTLHNILHEQGILHGPSL